MLRSFAGFPQLPLMLVLFVVSALPAIAGSQLVGDVVDENGAIVAGARVSISGEGNNPQVVTSNEAGRFALPSIPPGTYVLAVEKLGFYTFVDSEFVIDISAAPLQVVLNHRQESEETVSVVYFRPVIDRQETAAETTLTAEAIVGMPFSASHDFRNALPLIPGVIKDTAGRVHINGGGENQAYYSLDGFNITSPVSGILENRISADAIRAVRVETSRYSVEYGKGSAGTMALETMQGDDHFRFSATNFLPSYEFHNGLGISNWNPRASFSGPLAKGRAWLFNAVDLQYDRNIVDGLPPAANTNRNWFGSNLTRLQINLTRRNILTSGLLFNFQNSRHLGLSPLSPIETSRDRQERFSFISLKDQMYFSNGWVLETGAALNHMTTRDMPQGNDLPYRITPQGSYGNYFMSSRGRVERLQLTTSLLLPLWNWNGRHNLKFGIDGNRIRYRQFSFRRPFEVERLRGTRSRLVAFTGGPGYGRDNSEFSAYAQDRWVLNDQVTIDGGLRLDWDQIIRQPLFSPRIGVTWGPARMPDSKFSAGVGVFRDAVNLGLLTRSLDQQRWDTFFAPDGATVVSGPVRSRYLVDERALQAPYYLNWSFGWEQKLPKQFYIRTNFIRKQGRNGWAYNYVPAVSDGNQPGDFRLEDSRRDSYYFLEWTVTRVFQKKYSWVLSYARSSTRSSAVLDFPLDNPLFGRQSAGPLDWDSPNRLISWGLLPAPRFNKYSIAYFVEWHSGLPYSSVNELQQLVGAPNARRFPDYFSANVHVERRFHFFRGDWALRAGFNNITGHHNPMVVNNNIDSPDFRTFSGGQGRVFTGRFRFLGRN